MITDPFHPILSCKESKDYERKVLGEALDKSWNVMKKVGKALGNALIRDLNECYPVPQKPTILLLLGTGHNAGDALLAAERILKSYTHSRIKLVFVYGIDKLKPLTQRAYEQLIKTSKEIGQAESHEVVVETVTLDSHYAANPKSPQALFEFLSRGTEFDVCIDGILGMSFQGPIRQPGRAIIEAVNNFPHIRFRAAVDLPSGIGDVSEDIHFKADFTYAAGIAKKPVFAFENTESVGRIRYIDAGFFDEITTETFPDTSKVLLPEVLNPLKRLRPTLTDKRSFGHLFVVSGSRSMFGATLMTIKAALKSGVGLLTGCIPESLLSAAVMSIPEAMWIPCPETPSGSISLAALDQIKDSIKNKATGLLVGPGMSKDEDTLKLIEAIVSFASVPTIIDADALMPVVIDAVKSRQKGSAKVIATPHWGEFKRLNPDLDRINVDKSLKEYASNNGIITLLKGALTRISDGNYVVYSTLGNPVLARGGSGDILSGILGGLISQPELQKDIFISSCQGVALQGMAADSLAREFGQIGVSTTQILKQIHTILHSK